MAGEQQASSILKFLSRPKPLRASEPQKRHSSFPLEDNPLEDVSDGTRSILSFATSKPLGTPHDRVHKLGRSLPQLFSKPLYQCHPQLNLSSNESFCELSVTPKARCLPTKEPSAEQLPGDLEFESRFECGNLALSARGCEPNSYLLALRKDLNKSGGSTQWFFFRATNNEVVGVVRFHIVNFTKSYSSYTDGMQPVVSAGRGFERGCTDIDYRRNSLPRNHSELLFYYTLSFSYEFKRPGEMVYFCHSFPYSYTRLQKYITKLEFSHPRTLYKRRIGSTVLGNNIDCLTITNTDSNKTKPVIFINCRVHPGETPSSYVLEGVIDGLLAATKQSEHMRNELVFKIVPMLNPDGVIHGNYRTSFAGVDLNRCWSTEDKPEPEVTAAKNILKETGGTRLAFLDLHGHSKKEGVFAYGCTNRCNPFTAKQFPYLMHKVLKDFNYYNCNFLVEENRGGTARVAVWRQFGITYSYTVETSFLGPVKQHSPYTIKDYHRIGGQLVEAIYQYFCQKRFGISPEVSNIIGELYKDDRLLKVGDNPSEGSSSEYDSEPLDGISKELEPSQSKSKTPSSSPKKHTSPQTAAIFRRTRIGLKKPRMTATQLQPKVTEINLNKASDQEQQDPIPLLVSIGQRFGRTVQLRESTWRYPFEQAAGMRKLVTKTSAVVRQSEQRSCYVSLRKTKTGGCTDKPPSEASRQLSLANPRSSSFALELGRNRFYLL